MEERLQDGAREPVDERVDALARARARAGRRERRRRGRGARHVLGYPAANRLVTVRGHVDGHPNPARRPRRCGGRGGMGGPAAARPPCVRRRLRRHGAARPLGRAVGRAVAARRRRAAPRQRRGVRRGLRQRRALAARARRCCAGRSAGLAEHLATWPGTAVLDRVHPARSDLPQLWGSGRAFAQATWRHVLFGFVLGRAGAAAQPARGAARAGRRGGRLDERPRLGRAPRRRPAPARPEPRASSSPARRLRGRPSRGRVHGSRRRRRLADAFRRRARGVAVDLLDARRDARGDRRRGAGRRLPPRRARARRALVGRSRPRR